MGKRITDKKRLDWLGQRRCRVGRNIVVGISYAFERRPVWGKWELGAETTTIRYHWATPSESDMTVPRGICGAKVIIR